MQQWRDSGLAERLQHHRRFPEVQIAIFLRFWDSHRQMIRKFLHCVLSMIHREFIMEERSQLPL